MPIGLSFEEELTCTLDGFRVQLSTFLLNAMFGTFVGSELVATAVVSRVG